MIEREMLQWRPLQLAALAVLVGVGLASAATVRATRIDPVPDAPPPTFPSADAIATTPPGPLVDVRGVVSVNAFSPAHTAPARRYSVTGYAEVTPAAPPVVPTVLGTAVYASAAESFAMCRVGAGPVLVMRIGGEIGGFVVRAIERNLVVFTSPNGERTEVRANTRAPAAAGRANR